jgi:hypothetical protein
VPQKRQLYSRQSHGKQIDKRTLVEDVTKLKKIFFIPCLNS